MTSSRPHSSGKDGTASRETILIAVFGAMWGLMEITLGVTLKGLRIPMGGAIMASVSSIIFLSGRYFARRRGSIILMGAVAATLKIFSVGTIIAGPFMAILIEAFLAEVLISLFGVHRFSYVLTPVLLQLYTMLHPFLAQGILFGTDIYTMYLETLRSISRLVHLETRHLLWVVISWAGIHALLGATAGWLAFSLCRRVERELRLRGRETVEER